MTALESVKDILSKQLRVDIDSITEETNIMEDLGADSLDVYQIMLGIENEFDIELDPEKVETIRTVEEALHLLKSATRE